MQYGLDWDFTKNWCKTVVNASIPCMMNRMNGMKRPWWHVVCVLLRKSPWVSIWKLQKVMTIDSYLFCRMKAVIKVKVFFVKASCSDSHYGIYMFWVRWKHAFDENFDIGWEFLPSTFFKLTINIESYVMMTFAHSFFFIHFHSSSFIPLVAKDIIYACLCL